MYTLESCWLHKDLNESFLFGGLILEGDICKIILSDLT